MVGNISDAIRRFELSVGFEYAQQCKTCDHYDTRSERCAIKLAFLERLGTLDPSYLRVFSTVDPDGICQEYK